MTIEHRNAFDLGFSLVDLYGFNTRGAELEREYQDRAIGVYALLKALGIPDMKSLIKRRPSPDDKERSVTGDLWNEYQRIFMTLGRALRSGHPGEIYYMYGLGFSLGGLAVSLKNRRPENEQESVLFRQSIQAACNNISYFLRRIPQLPEDFVERIESIARRAEQTTSGSTEAHRIVEEVISLYSDLLEVSEGIPGAGSAQQEKERSKVKILFLAADPTDQSHLRLGQEFREIEEQLALAMLRERFELTLPRLSLRPWDISRALLSERPQIVHFSGHGSLKGLYFENEKGESHLVGSEALAALFEVFANQVKCVVLNACYSDRQAKAIARHIEYVVGMDRTVSDKAAIAFAVGFYQAIGAGRPIEEAYKLGCAQINLQGMPEHFVPVLIKKESTNNN